jgi:Mg-chelatase subunit ChlD
MTKAITITPKTSVITVNNQKQIAVLANIKALTSTLPQNLSGDALTTGLQTMDRSPIEIVAVIDTSGSMDVHINLVKDTLLFFIELLQETDRLCIITFSNNALIRMESTYMNEVGKYKAAEVINSLKAGGGTNIRSGLELALQHGLANRKNLVFSVFLFTDGHDSLSTTVTDTQKMLHESIAKTPYQKNEHAQTLILQQISEQGFCSTIPIEIIQNIFSYLQPHDNQYFTINTFGFGNDHNENYLKAIADFQYGLYHYMKDSESIATTFAECMGGLLSVVAQKMVLRIESNNTMKILKIVTNLETKVLNPYCYLVNIGDIQQDEAKDVIIVLDTDYYALNKTSAKSTPVAILTLNYVNVLRNRQEQVTRTVVFKPLANIDNSQIEYQWTRMSAIETLNRLDRNRVSVLDMVNELQTALHGMSNSPSRTQLQELINEYAEIIKLLQQHNTMHAFKVMTSVLSSHSRQRSVGVSGSSHSMYGTNIRRTVQASFREYMQRRYQMKRQSAICDACGKVGHFWRDCDKAKNHDSKWAEKDRLSRTTTKCLICNQFGHFARECPTAENKKNVPLICYNCGQSDHHANNCPHPPKDKSKATVPATTTRSSSNSSFSNNKFLTTGKKLRLKGLPFKGITEQTIRDFFQGKFTILSIEIVNKGEAYVTFDSSIDAQTAKAQFDGKYIGSRFIKIDLL